jgi:CTP:molybdopterin cytidylyltransferase MocA
LQALHGPEGAAALVRQWAADGMLTQLDLDDPGIVIDIDTLADLEQVHRRLAGD